METIRQSPTVVICQDLIVLSATENKRIVVQHDIFVVVEVNV